MTTKTTTTNDEKHAKNKNDDDNNDNTMTTITTPASDDNNEKPSPKTKNIVTKLTETSTHILYTIPASHLSQQQKQQQQPSLNSPKQQRKTTNNTGGKDDTQTKERAAQTFHSSQRTKESMAVPPLTQNEGSCCGMGLTVDNKSQNDALLDMILPPTTTLTTTTTTTTPLGKLVECITSAAVSGSGCLLDIGEGVHNYHLRRRQRQEKLERRRLKRSGEEDDDDDDDEEKEEPPTMAFSSSIGNGLEVPSSSLSDIIRHWSHQRILTSPKLAERLHWMERVVEQTHHVRDQLEYRTVPFGSDAELIKDEGKEMEVETTTTTTMDETEDDVCGDDDSGDPASPADAAAAAAWLPCLFRFQCHLSIDRPVNCLCWHKLNRDILAAGYGPSSSPPAQDSTSPSGLILFWSLRNSIHPERIWTTAAGVTSIDFSTSEPRLMAVGFSDGRVAIYDTSDGGGGNNDPVLDSAFTPGRHMVPVYQVKWVERGPERSSGVGSGERLLSIASDGKILEWEWYAHKGGLSFTSLMLLKRIGSHNGPISRTAAGLCLDFPTTDSKLIYFAGSDDGTIYRCSRSYNEQHLDAFAGRHVGPVTQLRCSPFSPRVFLTSGDDWTTNVWLLRDDHHAAGGEGEGGGGGGGSGKWVVVRTVSSMDLCDGVNDVAWSRTNPTVFACVAGDGRLEVWDVRRSFLDPIVKQFDVGGDNDEGDEEGTTRRSRRYESKRTEKTRGRSAVLFGDNDSVIVAGDDKGTIEVFGLKKLRLQSSDSRAAGEGRGGGGGIMGNNGHQPNEGTFGIDRTLQRDILHEVLLSSMTTTTSTTTGSDVSNK